VSLVVFFVVAALSPPVQDGAGEPRVYRPPMVRPFEPPSNFGRVQAEGDGGGDTRRAPIIAPVAVEAYARSYEYTPSTADSAYDRGVDDAEAAMDARMGPLDGMWRLVVDDGVTVGWLALSDSGTGREIEGALRTIDPVGGPTPVIQARLSHDSLVVESASGRLELVRGAEGWNGLWVANERSRPVRLIR
jgi:hypothetical protein